jgi:hypothetical protein
LEQNTQHFAGAGPSARKQDLARLTIPRVRCRHSPAIAKAIRNCRVFPGMAMSARSIAFPILVYPSDYRTVERISSGFVDAPMKLIHLS